MIENLKKQIDQQGLNSLSQEQRDWIESQIADLDAGRLRVVNRSSEGLWSVNASAKEIILLYFRIRGMQEMSAGDLHFCDKIPTKKWQVHEGVRVVPPAVVRKGAHIEPGAIMMPSFVNIGAHVGAGTLVDTWATVGSCAYIGKNVHLSGGVGIGGVLEPVQALPVIIEDDCFLGSRAIVVEGVHVGEGAVLGAGTVLTASTKIIDVTNANEVIHKGFVPPRSVVIPGSYSKTFPAGTYQVPCALIIGLRKESTDKKTSLNEALRDHQVSV
jgi:2,3,4,5-tetrahydropyridine-2-carboxylate N-succinyltransferase